MSRRSSQRPSIIGLALVLGVCIAIAKPWGAAAPSATSGPNLGREVGDGTEPPAPPTATPDPDLERVASFCLQPDGWRLFASETFGAQHVRSWKTMTPIAAATGPDDPAIPLFEEASRAVLTLGYCAPAEGSEQPLAATETTIFRRVEPAAGRIEWRIIRPTRVQPTGGDSRFGGAWAPPAGVPAPAGTGVGGWPSGTYVFRITGKAVGGAASYERWFGIVVDILPPPS